VEFRVTDIQVSVKKAFRVPVGHQDRHYHGADDLSVADVVKTAIGGRILCLWSITGRA
jgi:hypothetical protein